MASALFEQENEMLTPAKDDPNRRSELERMKKNPGAFGVVMDAPTQPLASSGGLVPAERKAGSVTDYDAEKYAAELKAWAEDTATKTVADILLLVPTAEKLHLEYLIAAETANKKRKILLDELNDALIKLK